jgi:hypothetical protein
MGKKQSSPRLALTQLRTQVGEGRPERGPGGHRTASGAGAGSADGTGTSTRLLRLR